VLGLLPVTELMPCVKNPVIGMPPVVCRPTVGTLPPTLAIGAPPPVKVFKRFFTSVTIVSKKPMTARMTAMMITSPTVPLTDSRASRKPPATLTWHFPRLVSRAELLYLPLSLLPAS